MSRFDRLSLRWPGVADVNVSFCQMALKFYWWTRRPIKRMYIRNPLSTHLYKGMGTFYCWDCVYGMVHSLCVTQCVRWVSNQRWSISLVRIKFIRLCELYILQVTCILVVNPVSLEENKNVKSVRITSYSAIFGNFNEMGLILLRIFWTNQMHWTSSTEYESFLQTVYIFSLFAILIFQIVTWHMRHGFSWYVWFNVKITCVVNI